MQMCQVNECFWRLATVMVRQPAVLPLITHDGKSWGVEPIIIRTTVITQLPFPAPRRPAATPVRDTPERRNERTAR